MDESEVEICPNCKREIPAVNFTIHSVHCARNIKVCPVCKEPVPQAELQEHHEKLHKEMPCKQCGEKVCGTDLEDHIRDSCGHTIKSCRYCELELPRRELPAHESYCGVRTEQCPDCREWVMIKYRQLHLDSNHGFLRLDDDPMPQPVKAPLRSPNLPRPAFATPVTNQQPTTSNGLKDTNLTRNRPQTVIRHYGNEFSDPMPQPVKAPIRSPNPPRPAFASPIANQQPTTSNGLKDTNLTRNRPQTVIRHFGSATNGLSTSSSAANINRPLESPRNHIPPIRNALANGSSRPENQLQNGMGAKVLKKRTNEQPQINTTVTSQNKVDTQPISRGAVKKRPAPQPPRRPPTDDPKRDLAYHSALLRSQNEERQRQEQNAYNLAHGLPPVLTPAAKLEKLRKMDALHNRETDSKDYKNCLQGRVWMDRNHVPVGNVLGSSDEANASLEADRRRKTNNHREDFNDLKPMSTQQFMEKFKQLQLRKDAERTADRFSEIKSSLRELRRGLNEVTAPYNTPNNSASNPNTANSNHKPRPGRSPRRSLLPPDSGDIRGFTEPTLSTRGYPEPVLSSGGFPEPVIGNREYQEPALGNRRYQEPALGNRGYQEPVLGNRGYQEPVLASGGHQEPVSGTRRFLETVLDAGGLLASALGGGRFPEPDLGCGEFEETALGDDGTDMDQEDGVFLPCEFCGAAVLADSLVQHQTGCRPDLAQYRPGSLSPHSPRSASPHFTPTAGPTPTPTAGPTATQPEMQKEDVPVIPCEFCMQSLPVYLISEHQERCGRESNFLYRD